MDFSKKKSSLKKDYYSLLMDFTVNQYVVMIFFRNGK